MPRARLDEPYAVTRRRMVKETEIALTIGLRSYEQQPRIPRVEVGKGTFTREYAARYWHQTLGLTYPEYLSADRLRELGLPGS